MSGYTKLDGFYTEQLPDGVGVGGVSMTQQLGNGTTVEFLSPFLPIGNGLAILPAMAPDGKTELRIDFALWSPARVGAGKATALLMITADQDTAVRIARAFDADPTTSWDDPPPVVADWLHAWGQTSGVPVSSS